MSAYVEKLFFCLIVVAVGLTASGSEPVKPDPNELLAKVNGAKIERRDVEIAFQMDAAQREGSLVTISPAAVPMRKKAILLQLVQAELLYQEAVRRGFSVEQKELDEVVSAMKTRGTPRSLPVRVMPMLKEADIQNLARHSIMLGKLTSDIAGGIDISDEDARRFFEKHKSSYITKEEVDLRQILVRVKSADDINIAKQKIERIRDDIVNGSDFAELARKYSDDPSAEKGGKIGTFQIGTLAKSFEKVAFSTPVGEVSQPVRTRFGFHLIKVDDHRMPRQQTFDEVHGQVISDMTRFATDRALDRLAEKLWTTGHVWYKDTWNSKSARTDWSR
ncbi:MAG: peptidylprolyl isomerase [Candidatus Hydrogenedentes bacterium]|nr:peptidylprolyl isomerase [Candidatus Hydrogenedentota bacterium]